MEDKEIFFALCLKTSDLSEKIQFNSPENLSHELLNSKKIKKGSDNYSLYIFYVKSEIEKEKKSLEIKFELNDKNYKLSLKIKSKITFDFKPKLELENWIWKNKEIPQTDISYKDKLIVFYEALTNQNKISYEKNLFHEAIDTFEGNKTLQYFLLLFAHCDTNDIYKLFCLFPKDIKDINENYNFKESKKNFEEIYKKKNEYFNIIEKEKNNNKKKEPKEKIEIIYYLAIIYYFLIIEDKEKSSEIIKDLYNENKGILFEILEKYSSIFKKFNIVDKDLLNELLSDSNEENIENVKNI
jgi:hypothetical protein